MFCDMAEEIKWKPSTAIVRVQKKDTMTVRPDVPSGLLVMEGSTITNYLLSLLGVEGNYHIPPHWALP